MVEHFEALGFITDRGALEMENREAMLTALRYFPRGASVVVSVTVGGRKLRSLKANNYYWGQVLTVMSKEGSDGDQSPEEIHDAMCVMFLPNEHKRVEFFNRLTGERLEVETDGRRSSKQSSTEFYDFVERVRKFALEFMGVRTEDPDPSYWRKRARVGEAERVA